MEGKEGAGVGPCELSNLSRFHTCSAPAAGVPSWSSHMPSSYPLLALCGSSLPQGFSCSSPASLSLRPMEAFIEVQVTSSRRPSLTTSLM